MSVVLYFMSVNGIVFYVSQSMVFSQWYCILCKSVNGIVFYVSQSVVLYFMSVSQWYCILVSQSVLYFMSVS